MRRQGNAVVEPLIVIAIVLIMLVAAVPNLLRAATADQAQFVEDGRLPCPAGRERAASIFMLQGQRRNCGKVSETILTAR